MKEPPERVASLVEDIHLSSEAIFQSSASLFGKIVNGCSDEATNDNPNTFCIQLYERT